MFADVTTDGHIRSYAALMTAGDRLVTSGPTVLPRLMGSGYVAFTVDQALPKDLAIVIRELLNLKAHIWGTVQ